MTAKPTPGPWMVMSHLGGERQYRIGRYVDSFSYKIITDILDSDFPDDRTANANLIAASPELLDALKADVHDMREVRNLVEGLEGDKIEIQRLKDLLDGRLHFSGLSIERAEGRAPNHE